MKYILWVMILCMLSRFFWFKSSAFYIKHIYKRHLLWKVLRSDSNSLSHRSAMHQIPNMIKKKEEESKEPPWQHLLTTFGYYLPLPSATCTSLTDKYIHPLFIQILFLFWFVGWASVGRSVGRSTKQTINDRFTLLHMKYTFSVSRLFILRFFFFCHRILFCSYLRWADFW